MTQERNQPEARRIAKLAYPYPGCCPHLDHNSGNNNPDNLAWLCRHHHWMFDVGLFDMEALKLQRTYWQSIKGKHTNAYMKDAGRKAAVTRARREAALKAVATRRARLAAVSRPI
jgi:hypothetical protein